MLTREVQHYVLLFILENNVYQARPREVGSRCAAHGPKLLGAMSMSIKCTEYTCLVVHT
jgi:hypothetical protein